MCSGKGEDKNFNVYCMLYIWMYLNKQGGSLKNNA